MAAGIPAVDGIETARHGDAAAAEKAGIHIDRAGLKPHGKRDDLECRAGLIGIRERLVAPLGVARLGHDGILDIFVRDVLDLFLGLLVHLKVVVRIIIAERRHAEDRAGVHVHDDPGCAILEVIALLGNLEVLFQVILHRLINGEDDAFAVLRVVVILKIRKQHVGAVRSSGSDDAPVCTGKDTVVLILHAGQSVIVGADKAYHMARKARIGIVAFCGLLDLDSLVLDGHGLSVFIDPLVPRLLEGADLLGDLVVHLAGDRHVPGIPLQALFVDRGVIDVQDLGQRLRDLRRILVVHRHLSRAEIDIRDGSAHRKDIHVPVIDRAALGRDGGLPQLLVDSLRLVKIMLQDLDLEQLQSQE